MSWKLVILACVGFLAQHGLAQPPIIRSADLRCESLANPIGLDVAVPRFSWIPQSQRRGERQTAYHILVSSSRALLDQDQGDLWDSGRVESAETTHVNYAGERLVSRRACFWKVRSWNRDGAPGQWSEPGTFEMGLMASADWSASWVDASPSTHEVTIVKAEYKTRDGQTSVDVTQRVSAMITKGEAVVASNAAMGGDPAFGVPKELHIQYTTGGTPFRVVVNENTVAPVPPKSIPYLRKEFLANKPVARARLHATALGVYEVWINGQRVGDHRLAPGWTDYRKVVQVQSYDVTSSLRTGPNAIGAIVGPGWFSGRAGLFHARAFYGQSPALLAQLEIEFEDGSTQRIVSDGSWMRNDGPILAADIMDGEVHDARQVVVGWCDPSPIGKGTGWTPTKTRDEARTLRAQSDQPVRVLAELPTKAISEPLPGRWVFDVGQNMVGVARLRVQEEAGTKLTIRHAEMLNADGTLYTANLRGAAATDTYICRGSGVEVWEPQFTFHGFRYVEVTGLSTKPEMNMVTGIVIGTDLPQIGEFVCSDERVNRLQSNIVWGLRGNMLSIPTDCPQRDERMGWTADAQVFIPTACYNADVGPFMAKWMRDIRDAKRADGAHSDVAPVMNGLTYGTPVWGDAGTVIPWAVYVFTGDRRILEENIESMRRWVDWSVAHSTGYIRDRDRGNDYGDWLSIDADTPKDLIGTAYSARSAWIVAESLKAIGRVQESKQYQNHFEHFRAAFIERYLDKNGVVGNGTQTCDLLALRFNLVPESNRDVVSKHLVDNLKNRGWRLSTGFVGVSHLLPALDDAGQSEAAYRLLLQDAFPSWLFSVNHGATTIWERWDGWTPGKGMNDPGMNSFNHFALGSCGEWLFGGVAGIRPDPACPGFSRFIVTPRIGGSLSHARATYRSVRGTIESGWLLEDGQLKLTVTVPTNTSAVISIPARPGLAVLESGVAIESAEGVRVVGRSENEIVLEVGSGTYKFTTTPPANRPGNPVISGWYADPDAVVIGNRAWMYPTYSAPYGEQRHFDAFSSDDLVTWQRHPKVLEAASVPWAKRAMWAPAVVEKDGKYYFFFAANDIQSDSEQGGIGVAVAERPEGPFKDHLGKPLVDAFHHGAQPIDPFVFRDADGKDYLIFGGWKHCCIARLNADFTGFIPFDDGSTFREITPDGYVEGPVMFRRDGKCYFMWSEGGWTGPDYRVAYGVADSPLGPFKKIGTVLTQDPAIATGAGHHSVLHLQRPDRYYIVYHRRPLGEKNANHRIVCIEPMEFDEAGNIKPVKLSHEGVLPTNVKPKVDAP